MTKSQLRKIYQTKRNQLSEAEYVVLNKKLLEQFEKIDLTGIHCIHLFLPIIKKREPDTWLLRDWLKNNYPEIKIAFPQTDFSTLSMRNFTDDDTLQLAPNAWGITEPVAGTEINTDEIDLVIIPLLAFDEQGYRVGYGKGFYDRFLTQCRPDVQRMGLSFFEPVGLIEDVDVYDMRMDACITPEQIYYWH